MKARPILMSGPLVRALLEGRKTQTRRPVKPQPDVPCDCWIQPMHGMGYDGKSPHGDFRKWTIAGPDYPDTEEDRIFCPYGQPGDLLWVRETWSQHPEFADIAYRAEGEEWEDSDGGYWEPKWKPSIFMPRWASRITLRLTDVRVERLQDISGVDAKQEGMPVPAHLPHDGADLEWARREFFSTWQRIHGKAWRGNPWVWALTFEVIKANVDTVLREKAA